MEKLKEQGVDTHGREREFETLMNFSLRQVRRTILNGETQTGDKNEQ